MLTSTEDRLRVLLTTEGTYPFAWGGLATWCDSLIRELPEVAFSVLALCDDPCAELRFPRAANVVELRPVPIWGIRRASDLSGRRRRPSGDLDVFVPAYRRFVAQVLGARRDDAQLARDLHVMYRILSRGDFDGILRAQPVWEALCAEAESRFPVLAQRLGRPDARLSFADVADAAHWLYHWLFPLAEPVPEVDVAHATAGGIPALLALVCKLEHGAGFVLSEHGIYLRERYLAEHASREGLFAKAFKLGFARRATELAYASADAIAPCCDYNRRWEQRLGVRGGRIRTAYYGLGRPPGRRSPRPRAGGAVVVWAGRIDPLKDVETLLRAAAVVRRAHPDARFRLYGAAPAGQAAYEARCRVLHRRLGLGDGVSFEGFTSDVPAAFEQADVVVLSSISEGFPYATLEAMVCGKPVVATAIGGIAEQITPDCGRVVPPRDPEALGAAVEELLADEELRRRLGAAARARVDDVFGLDRFRATHRSIYETVRPRSIPAAASAAA